MRSDKIDLVGARILVVDDELTTVDILRKELEPKGYRFSLANNGKEALEVASRRVKPDLILLDVLMPEMDGFETCRQLKKDESTRDIPVIFITAKGETESVINGFRVGGVDYIAKPFQIEEVLIRVETHLKNSLLMKALSQKNDELQQEIAKRKQAEEARNQAEEARQKADDQLSMITQQEAQRWGIAGFIGKSKTIERILVDVRQLQSTGKTTVLITGESGTGKELIARAIHFGGLRAKGPFIPVNCSAIPKDLIESELFGHERGAFTGATGRHLGKFELANGGTIFLDEIGDMATETQAKVLRALVENKEFQRVGGTVTIKVDVRVIAATNKNIEAEIKAGNFREDLYYRLAGFTVTVPPLRERKEDIPLLALHFLKMFAAEMSRERATLSPEAMKALEAYHFPGNVRELKNIIESALIRSGNSEIRPEHLHFVQPTVVQENEAMRKNFVGFQTANDNVREFIDECCEIVLYTEIHKPELFAIYQSFCRRNKYHPASRNEFYRRILELYPQVEDTLITKERVKGFKGLRLKNR